MDRGSLRVAAALSHKDPVTRAAFCASHGDDNLSLDVSFSLVPKRFGDLTQLVARSMTGAIFSASTSSFRTARSSLLCLPTNTRIRRRTNGDSKSALT